jgi:hypothetical protein
VFLTLQYKYKKKIAYLIKAAAVTGAAQSKRGLISLTSLVCIVTEAMLN